MRTQQVSVWERRKTDARKAEKRELRKQNKAKTKASARKQAPQETPVEVPESLSFLKQLLRKKSPKTLDSRSVRIQGRLSLLEELAPKWVRSPNTWRKKGKSPEAVMHSLSTHLLIRYPVPLFLWGALFLHPEYLDLILHIGAGGSLRKSELIKQLIPAKMTKRMWHLFLSTTKPDELVMAIRYAQIRGLGGSFELWQALGRTSIGEAFGDEEFYFSVIQWFCNHPLIAPQQIGPLIDYITYLSGETPNFSMKGRSANALFRGMENWHHELARYQKVHGLKYLPSGFPGWAMVTQEPGKWVRNKYETLKVSWEIQEILSSKELAAEGRDLRHCVVSYGGAVAAGRRSIWSLRRDGVRCLTLEVRNTRQTIVQIRGLGNRLADWSETQQIKAWADTAGLQITPRRW